MIVTPIDAAIHGPSSTISPPISLPASPSYAGPSAAWMRRSPTSANTPAAAATTGEGDERRADDVAASRAPARAPARVSGTLETIPSDDAVTATSAAATRYA